MGDDSVLTQSLGKLMGQPFHQPTGINENQRGSMCAYQVGHRVQCLAPHLMGGNGAQLSLRQFDCQIYCPGVTGVHDQAIRFVVGRYGITTHQEPTNFFYRPLGGRKTDADDWVICQGAKSLN